MEETTRTVTTGRPLPSLRTKLAVIVLACAVPALLGFALLVSYFYARERVQIQRDTLQAARALVLAVDRDMDSSKSAALALATSPALAANDLAAFHAQAKSVLRDDFPGFAVVLSDPAGQQVVNTLRPFGEPLPRHGNPEQLRQVFATGKPLVSDVYIGGVLRRPVLGIDVPVWRDGKVVYVLSVGIQPERLGKLLTAQKVPADRIAAIFDTKGIIVARTHEPERFVGTKGAAGLLDRLRQADEGVVEVMSVEGVPLFSNFSRSPTSGWTVAIGVRQSTVAAELLQSVISISALALAVLAAGIALAWYLGGAISRSVKALVAPAAALESAGRRPKYAMGFREADEVAAELSRHRQHLEGLVEERTVELDKARQAAEVANRAKSQFLANMSHELRTPLNSLLILAQLLSENDSGNLTAKQAEYARTIHGAGSDLLELINDLLDLAKIEAGHMEVVIDELRFDTLCEAVRSSLGPLAQAKGLELVIDPAADLPATMHTDAVRLLQVLRNLIGNAVKFTPAGRVTLRIEPVSDGWSARHPTLSQASAVIALSVSDTGIGIAPDKQQLIFEAFQQADGSTARSYGGTGLGLSISREIARLLGGELTLRSEPGVGSTFTLFLPQGSAGRNELAPPAASGKARHAPADDREHILPGDAVVLIVEDNAPFARTLMEVAASHHMKCLLASSGDEALRLATLYRPTSITLDLNLTDCDGWALYERLSRDPATAEIPVMLLSVGDEHARTLEMGERAVLVEPVSRTALDAAFARISAQVHQTLSKLLVVEDNALERAMIVNNLQGLGISITEADSGQAALAALRAQSFDCIVLDLGLPDMSGLDVLEAINDDPATQDLPVIVHSTKLLGADERSHMRDAASTVITKGGRSYERLIAETSRFLRRSAARLPETPREVVVSPQESDRPLAGRKVLLVDDDIRNVFATSAMLEQHQLVVIPAMSGSEALALLPQHPDTALVLMDMMMPEMDGYETTRRLRSMNGYAALPVIAVTARAMADDREMCLAAGCSDYLSKPVDGDELLGKLRDWIPS